MERRKVTAYLLTLLLTTVLFAISAGAQDLTSQEAKTPTTTQWLSGLTLAHSFDPDLFHQLGQAMGKEFYDKVRLSCDADTGPNQ